MAADKVFCSIACRDSQVPGAADLPGITNGELLAGYDKPIVTGWKLWLRSTPALALHIAPLAVLAGIAFMFMPRTVSPEGELNFAELAFLLVLVLGVAVVQVVLSHQYTRLVQGNPIQWTLRHFLSWAATGVMVGAIVLVGFIALIVPGVILSLRLFWADEFALVHGFGPIRALKESWRLTEGEAGRIFVFQFLAGLAAYIPLMLCGLVFVGLRAALTWVRGDGADIVVLDGFMLSFFVLGFYSALHAPEIVYFYGMRATRAVPIVARGKVLGI